MSEGFWTPERIAELKRLSRKRTPDEIAKAMGVSKNTIIGKLYRLREGPPPGPTKLSEAEKHAIILDVQLHGGTASAAAVRLGCRADSARKLAVRIGLSFPARNAGTKGQRWRVSTPKPKPGTRDRKPANPAQRGALRRTEAPPPKGAIGLMELRDATVFRPGTCKWPVNDGHPFLFCGHETSLGKVYCGYHQCIAFAPRHRAERFCEAAE